MRFLLILALVLSQGPSQLQAQRNDTAKTAKRDQQAATSTPASGPLVTAPAVQPVGEGNPPPPPPDGEKEDALIFVAWLQLLAFVAQAIVLGFTWHVMRDTSRRQLRAYLHVNGIKEAPHPTDPTLLAFVIHVKNSGQTPAYDIKAWSGIGANSLPLVGELPDEPPGGATQQDSIIGPGGDIKIPVTQKGAVPPAGQALIKAGTASLYVFGRVEYRDAFGKQRYLNFCWSGAESGTHVRFRNCRTRNDAN